MSSRERIDYDGVRAEVSELFRKRLSVMNRVERKLAGVGTQGFVLAYPLTNEGPVFRFLLAPEDKIFFSFFLPLCALFIPRARCARRTSFSASSLMAMGISLGFSYRWPSKELLRSKAPFGLDMLSFLPRR